MKIANIELGERALLLAPMEDVTDPSFRYMCKRFGADMVYTEFISSDGLIRDAAKSLKKLEIDDTERPVGIQIYGHLIDPMVEAARMAEAAGPDVIDINFGCPVKKIAGRGAGSGMMRDGGEEARDGENPPRMGRGVEKHRRDSPAVAGCRHCGPHHSRAHAGADVPRRGRLDADRQGEEQSADTHSDHRQRRR